MRIAIGVAVTCLSIIGLSHAADVEAAIKRHTDIPAQDLASALRSLAKDRGFQIVFASKEVGDLRTRGAVGAFTTTEALAHLLDGTGLTYRYLDDKTITVAPLSSTSSRRMKGAIQGRSSFSRLGEQLHSLGEGFKGDGFHSKSESGVPVSHDGKRTEGKPESFWRRLRLAQNEQKADQPSEKEESQGEKLDEIIVTAQKREERLQDVPIPVTAISGDTLLRNNHLRLQDYFTSIPSLSVQPGQNAAPVLSIRGITTGEANPTVGIIVDDIPYGSSTFVGGGSGAPDLDPGDLQRVEVLRGPQGTLYGANSIGGLFKFVTIDPSTDEFSGRLQAGLSSVRDGSETGYNVRGAVNVPLSETWALRASGYSRRDPGYIDDPILNRRDVNRTTSEGGRASLLFRPSEDFSLKLGAMIQHSDRHGAPTVDQLPGLGDLQQSDPFGVGGYDRTVQNYSITATVGLGNTELISLTGYNKNRSNDSLNFSALLGGAAQATYGVAASALLSDIDNEKVTQELRLSVPFGERLDLLGGAFFTHEKSYYKQSVTAQDFFTGQLAGVFGDFLFNSELTEYAAFADLTVHFSDRFEIQFGGRQSHIDQSIVQTVNAISNPKINSKEDSFTYLVTPQFKMSPNLMMYARLASGYRPGGPNYNSPALGLPPTYEPDKTTNYEIGAKGELWNGVLAFDGSVYYIEWQDIQLALVDTAQAVGFTANGSEARSRGVELSMTVRPGAGLTIGAWGSWNDAELAEPFPANSPVVGRVTDRLPNAARFSGGITLDEAFPVGADMTGFIGVQTMYLGDRKGYFTADGTRQNFPSFVQVNLRAGMNFDTWKAEAFANNVTDRRGVLSGGLGTLTPTDFSYITPRMMGLNVTKTF